MEKILQNSLLSEFVTPVKELYSVLYSQKVGTSKCEIRKIFELLRIGDLK